MVSEAVRLFFAAGLSLLLGGVLGAWATRTIYGEEREEVSPMPVREKICAPCECPVCPPPPDCGSAGIIPTTTGTAVLVPEDESLETEQKPGISATALAKASEVVREAIAPCFAQLEAEVRGALVFDLTVVANGESCFISDAQLVSRSSGAVSSETLEGCLIQAAKTARFDWPSEDGEGHLRLPISLMR